MYVHHQNLKEKNHATVNVLVEKENICTSRELNYSYIVVTVSYVCILYIGRVFICKCSNEANMFMS